MVVRASRGEGTGQCFVKHVDKFVVFLGDSLFPFLFTGLGIECLLGFVQRERELLIVLFSGEACLGYGSNHTNIEFLGADSVGDRGDEG